MFKKEIVVGLLMVFACAAVARADEHEAIAQVLATMETKIRLEQKQVAEQEQALQQLNQDFEKAKSGKRRSHWIGIPVIVVGALVGSASGLAALGGLDKAAYTFGSGVLIIGGGSAYLYYSHHKENQIEEALNKAKSLVEQTKAKLASDLAELEEIKANLSH
jgi:hypothetical protein